MAFSFFSFVGSFDRMAGQLFWTASKCLLDITSLIYVEYLASHVDEFLYLCDYIIMATASTVSVSLLFLHALQASHIVCLESLETHPIGRHDLSLARNVDK